MAVSDGGTLTTSIIVIFSIEYAPTSRSDYLIFSLYRKLLIKLFEAHAFNLI